jgi:pimeloyl-ACP methyl ester carboxylesterase
MVRIMVDLEPRALGQDQNGNDPFDGRLDVPVAGGTLNVAYAGPTPGDAEAVVLAVHGVTASHMAWRTVARQLAGRSGACLIAPDLRGRGRSATLPGPYGLATHVSDLTAVLDNLGVQRTVMVGHSMGAHVAARLSAEQPERSAGLVLLDGGLPRLAPLQEADDEPEGADPTPGRLEGPCTSADAYVAGWRAHPAFAHAWDDDVDAYARYDMTDDGRGVRCVVREEAVTADGFDLVFDGVTRKALTRVRAPIHLLRAPRGAFDDDCPAIPREYLDAFAADHPHLEVEHVPGTNHYTIVLGSSPGPARVARAIERAVRAARRPVKA